MPHPQVTMSSERRIQASRANGAKSKGPKTPEGKARSSQNGVCHGLLANSLVLEEESKDIFTALHAEFVDEFAPSSPFESTLVGLMVAARWRCLRIWGMETSALDREMRNLAGAPQSAPEFVDASTRASLAIHSLGGATPSEGLLRRYEAHFERQFSRAFHIFVKYRQLNGTVFAARPSLGPVVTGGPVVTVGPDVNPLPGSPEPENSPPPPAPEPESARPVASSNADPVASPTPDGPKSCRRTSRKNRAQRRRELANQKVPSKPNPKNEQSRHMV